MESMHVAPRREPWNKGKLAGQKAPLKLKHIWAVDGADGHGACEALCFFLLLRDTASPPSEFSEIGIGPRERFHAINDTGRRSGRSARSRQPVIT